MKPTPLSVISLLLGATLACHADPVTGWVRTNGDSVFTGGSESTASPVVTGLPGDTIAANFTTITLVDHESVVLTGSVTFDGSAGGNQFRIGLFNGPSPVVEDVGSGYVGINADAPSTGSGGIKFGDGSATNPFSGGASSVIVSISNPSGTAPANIPISFTLTVTRDGDNLDLEASLSNKDDGGTWSASGTADDWEPPVGYTFDFNTVSFLMGGAIGGASADYSDLDVTKVEFDSDNDGMWDGWELANGLNVGIDDSAFDEDSDGGPDGLTNIQEYLGNDGVAETGDETNPQKADTDADGLKDGPEITEGTDPLDPDSDGDYFVDGFEIDRGTLPLDPNSVPWPSTDFVVDFSSDSTGGQTGLFHDQDAFPFVASHEVDAATDPLLGVDRSESWPVASLGGASVTATISYPDTTDPRVMQMIGRSDTNTADYDGTQPGLMRDWVGIDARATSGGNGTATPTTMRLNLAGLPDGTYQFRGYHHDVADQKGRFEIQVSDATRSAASLGFFRMTHSGTRFAGHQAANPGAGNPPSLLSSTVEFVFSVSGGSAVDIDYQVMQTTGSGGDFIRYSFFALDGFEITAAIDSDGDFVPDAEDLNPGDDDATLDQDSDNLNNLREFHLGTGQTTPDSDTDGWNDDVETDTDIFVSLSDTGTSPFVDDWDADGLKDGVETNDLDFSNWPTVSGTDPLVVDTDLDGYGDGDEATTGYDPTDPSSFPPPPPLSPRLIAVDLAAGTTTLEWNSVPGATYDIYASDTLEGDPEFDWELLSFAYPSEGNTTTYTETLPEPSPGKRFYVIIDFAP